MTNLDSINISISGTNDKCSQNYTITLAALNVINFTVIVNDTSDNKNQSEFIITVADNIIPDLNSSLNKSSDTILEADVINLTANVTDETGLSFGQIIVNDTGFVRFFNFSLNGVTEAQFSQNITVSCSEDCLQQ